jgi:hypothetical protein
LLAGSGREPIRFSIYQVVEIIKNARDPAWKTLSPLGSDLFELPP